VNLLEQLSIPKLDINYAISERIIEPKNLLELTIGDLDDENAKFLPLFTNLRSLEFC
jgi:hypothetical protein